MTRVIEILDSIRYSYESHGFEAETVYEAIEYVNNLEQRIVELEAQIKPSEAVYEYLFYDNEDNTKWMTIQEWDDHQEFIQTKSTKRVRQ